MIVNPVSIIAETYRNVLPNRFDSRLANIMLVAMGLQESRFIHRAQIGGPARGFWQFEKGGGVKGVLLHRASEKYATCACLLRNVNAGADPVYNRLATDDVLACAFARLLLYTYPTALPTTAEEGWKQYIATWRPGRPHRSTWNAFYAQAESMFPLTVP